MNKEIEQQIIQDNDTSEAIVKLRELSKTYYTFQKIGELVGLTSSACSSRYRNYFKRIERQKRKAKKPKKKKHYQRIIQGYVYQKSWNPIIDERAA